MSTPKLEEGAEISGRVTSQVNGEPVAGAEACAGAVAFDSYCANTNAAGEYTITRLPSHEYSVYFSGPGGLETEYLSQYYKEREWPEVEPVSVTAPHKVSGIDASLKAYGRITGTVIDKETKQPLEGVNVCLASGGCENTNRAGEYSFSKLPAGTYALDFDAGRLNEETGANYLSQYEANEYIVQEALKARNPQAAHVAVMMGGRTVIDDELEQGGRISGKMLEAGTENPASLWPCAENLSTGHPEQAKVCPLSMSGNTYTISQLPPGRYRVVFGASLPAYYFTQYYDGKDLQSEAQEVLVESGKTAAQIDASLIANPGPWEGAIAGTVTDSSSKAAIAGVEACPLNVGTTSTVGGCAVTGPRGEYPRRKRSMREDRGKRLLPSGRPCGRRLHGRLRNHARRRRILPPVLRRSDLRLRSTQRARRSRTHDRRGRRVPVHESPSWRRRDRGTRHRLLDQRSARRDRSLRL